MHEEFSCVHLRTKFNKNALTTSKPIFFPPSDHFNAKQKQQSTKMVSIAMHFRVEINSQDKHFLFRFICQFRRFLLDLLHRLIVLCCIFSSLLYSYSHLFIPQFVLQNLQTITWSNYGIWEAAENNRRMKEFGDMNNTLTRWFYELSDIYSFIKRATEI